MTPVRNEVQPPNYKAAYHAELVPGGEKPIGDVLPTDPVQRGFYLATLAHCMECHSRKPAGGQDYKNWWGKGGHVMKGPFGAVTVSNITAQPGEGHRRADRRPDQAGAHPRRRPRRPDAQDADGAAGLFQQAHRTGSQRHRRLGADHPAGRVSRLVGRAASRYIAAHDDCCRHRFAPPPPSKRPARV